MAFSKLTFLHHLKTLTLTATLIPNLRRHLSFATPDEAAAFRRQRKRRFRIEPPPNSLRTSNNSPHQRTSQSQNPNSPKLPDSIATLTVPRLNLHNKILTLIRENDLDEAALYTRHSVYSNCRPTIYTCNAVMWALYRQSHFADMLSLHRFIVQAGIAPSVVTYNMLIRVYCECGKVENGLEWYKRLVEDAPFGPNRTTFRVLVKGLVVDGRMERAVEVKDEMIGMGFEADAVVYSCLMGGFAKSGEADKVFEVYDEWKEKTGGGDVKEGILYGPLIKGYFLKGDEVATMGLYEEVSGESPKVKMGPEAYNFVLEALCKNKKFDEALRLFERMKALHSPPRKITVNLGSYNVIVDGYCGEGRFREAVEVFMGMDETAGCSPDILSFNNLIQQLCDNGLLSDAEELCGRIHEKGVRPDEVSYGLLMDTCFKDDRQDDAAGYFKKMVDEDLRPNMGVYSRLVDGLVKVGKVDEAKSFFDIMVKKLRMDAAAYEFIFKSLSDVGKLDDVLGIVNNLIDDGSVDLNDDMKQIIVDGLKKEGREDELGKLIERKEQEKAEAKRREIEEAEAEKARTRATVKSFLPLISKREESKEPDAESLSSNEDQTGREEALSSTHVESPVNGTGSVEAAGLNSSTSSDT
ncbi:Pentatricopeptide repeat-containing protein [Drosera capensis]